MANFNNVTIIVNSFDGFEDCWEPFFKLFTINWPNCNVPILLNTEFKSYSYPYLNIKNSKVNSKNSDRRLTWSECLTQALRQVNTEFVLYMQEDYFVEKPINTPVIDEFIDLMCNNRDIKYIGLTHFGNQPPFTKYERDDRLLVVSKKSKYRISTQAGLWDKNTLQLYLRPQESGWMFEIFGTKRSQRRNELFLTVDRNIFNPQKGAIIDYIHTGIIKGRWHPEIVSLFERNNISIDFEKRGFYEPQSTLLRKIETGRKLIKNPLCFIRGILGY